MKNIIPIIAAFIITAALFSFVIFAKSVFYEENTVTVISGFIMMVQIYYVISILKTTK